jgi:hypothetical protein
VLAFAFLWRLTGRIGFVLLLVVISGIVFRSAEPASFIQGVERPPSEVERALHAWIDRHPRRPVILSVRGRSLAASSQAVVHVPTCTSAAVVDIYIAELSLDYIVMEPGDQRRCPALRDIDPSRVAHVRDFGSGKRRIRVWRPSHAPAVVPLRRGDKTIPEPVPSAVPRD